MKSQLKLLALLILLLPAGWGLYHWLHPDDASQIRRTLERAVAACSWSSDAGNLQALSAANRLADLCTPEVEISLDFRGSRLVQGSDGVREALLAVRTRVRQLEVELGECEIAVVPESNRGVAQFVVTVTASGESEPWMQELRVTFERRGDGWRIARVAPVRGFGG